MKYYKNQPNFSEVLDNMTVLFNEIKVLHFKRNKGKGQKTDELVVLKKEDWYEIVKWMKEAKMV